ncbi:cutinase family protein [Mycobacterium sp. 1465703.0]|uniref:cutinase family protein n=1 Tax=Mycobacterium sp. 1465703.0 TaxID=1834078 RepID=UPI0007FD1C04|nr:cutinase family protein [Mycobacterium sp. 1465703.0]OBJ10897.1 cutinase [Mycobacterium sp. 1465703.0]
MVTFVSAAAVLVACALSRVFVESASADPCPYIHVIFARGTGEPAGVGPTGQAFIDNLHSGVGQRSLDVYPVNYPASDQWNTGIDGVRDAGAHVVSMAHACPKTAMVLAGYCQGAAIIGFITSATVPDGVDPSTVPKPLDPAIANHVSSVVLFGMPNVRAMNVLGEPPVVIGPLYQSKTLTVCAADDPVCSDGLNFATHNSNAADAPMIHQGAVFAASHLDTTPSNTAAVGRSDGGFGT